MKKVAVIFTILFLAGMLMKPFVPFVEYELNRDFIARVLCINKDKPQLKCNGKCHLSKQLRKAAEEDQKPQAPFSQKKIEWITAIVPEEMSEEKLTVPQAAEFVDFVQKLMGRTLPPPTPPPPSRA